MTSASSSELLEGATGTGFVLGKLNGKDRVLTVQVLTQAKFRLSTA